MKLSLILEAVDRISGPARNAAQGITALGSGAKVAAREIGPAARAVDLLNDRAKRSQAYFRRAEAGIVGLARGADAGERHITRVSAATFRWTRLTLRTADALDRATASAARYAGRAGLRAVEVAGNGAGRAMTFARTKLLALMATTARWGGIGLAAGAGFATKGVIATGMQFEQFQAQLEGTEGSVQKARSALQWVSKFAADTPYKIDEVTDALVRARGVGIDPFNGAMTQMGDAAAGSRKSLMSAVEAIADAQTGEFERLKEFNITSSVKGAEVTFEYLNKAGKNAKRTVAKDMAEVQKAVLAIFGDKYAGGMKRQALTLGGIWSNIQDKVTGFQLKVASAGFYDRVKSSLADVLSWLNRLESSGTLDRWAKAVSDNMSAAFEWASRFVRETNWEAVGDGLKVLGGVLKWILTLLRDIVGAVGAAANGLRWMANTRFSDVVGLTTPPVIAPKVTERTWQKALSAPKLPSPPKVINDNWSRGLANTSKGPRPASNSPASPRLAPPVLRPAASRTAAPIKAPTAKVDLTIKTERGTTARPTKVAASGMDIQVNTGHAMRGVA